MMYQWAEAKHSMLDRASSSVNFRYMTFELHDFHQRLASVRERMAQACERSGRSPDSVNLLAVSKTHGPDVVQGASEAGIEIFGENKVQEAKAKIPLCPGHLRWHLIGHLQTNKARDAAVLFDMVHSADSLKLLLALERAAEQAGRSSLPVLLEVNVSGEGTKFGFKPEEVPSVLEEANKMQRIQIQGLMTMPPFTKDAADARPHFARLRELRDKWRASSGYMLDELSMGMSHDFEVAIEEGATWIRLGAILFGERTKP